MTQYGHMLVLELRKCDSSKLNDDAFIKEFLLRVVEMAEMRPATIPIVFEEEPRQAGRGPGKTGLIGLTESHAAIHTYPHRSQRWAVFTLLSCKEFDMNRITYFTVAWFDAVGYKFQNVTIGEEFPRYKS